MFCCIFDGIQVEQIWSLLPGFFREPLDLLNGFTNGQIIISIISELDKPIIRDHICNALCSLCRQIQPFIESPIGEDNLEYQSSQHPFMKQLWFEISKIDSTPLRFQSTKLMGILTVKFLQSHRPTSGLAVSC